MLERDEVKVETNPEVSYLVGRNGTWDITAMSILSEDDHVKKAWVSGFGKKDNVLRGGFSVNLDAMESLCQKFLEQRGYQVEKPGGEHHCLYCGKGISEEQYNLGCGVCPVCEAEE